MSWHDDLGYRLSTLWRRGRHEDDLDEELRFHLEMEIERRMANGESRSEATRAARLDFGAPEAIKEACRDAWGTRWLDETWRDLKSAGRQGVKNPVLSSVVIASLAIGLGAATVIFSLVDAVLLRPLPYQDPDRIVALYERTPQGADFSSSDPNLLDFREYASTLSEVAAVTFPRPQPALAREGSRVQLSGHGVTPSFFEVLGVEAQIGRTFGAAEEMATAPPRVAVLSHAGWQRYFAGDPEIVGRPIDLDGERWTVLGVLPEGFDYPGSAEIFLPYRFDPDYDRGDRRLDAHARLAPGVTLEEARQELAAIAANLSDRYAESNAGWGADVRPLEDYLMGETTRRTHWMLLAAVGLLLTLASVNVSNLLLARADDRLDEMGLRLALGAGRGRVIRQLMVESLIFGLAGAALALVLASWAIPWVRGLGVSLPRMDTMGLDLRVVGALVVVAVATSLLFGLLPALRSTAVSLGSAIRSRRQGSGPRQSRLRSALVVAEVALATLLTVGAGLLLHSFEALRGVDSGFDTEGVLLVQIDLPRDRYGEGSEATTTFFRQLTEEVEGLSRVEAVGATMVSPFRGPRPRNRIAVETETDRDGFVPIHWRAVTPQTFRALQVPMLRGRSFEDGTEPRMEAVVSASLADRLWPAQDPIGRPFRWIGPEGPLFEVIGVVGEVQDLALGEVPPPTVYLPQSLVGWPSMTLVVRSADSLEPLARAIRAALAELDPLLASPELDTLADRRREALGEPLLSLRLVALAALIAVLLAAVGVYGVMAYAVSRRRRELGVRLALGARSSQLVEMVVRDGARRVIAGLVVGLLAAAGLTGTLRALLFETSPLDPGVLAGVGTILLVVGLAACAFPALRAGRVDPITVLHED